MANLIGLTVGKIVLDTSFSSVWHAYAVVLSLLILVFFRQHAGRHQARQRTIDRQQSGPSAGRGGHERGRCGYAE